MAQTTLSICPDSLWLKLPFLADPQAPSFWYDVTSWKMQQIKEYATGHLLDQLTANLAFLALAIISLLLFWMWRVLRRFLRCCPCFECCCLCPRICSSDPRVALKGTGMWVIKILLVGIACAAIGIAIAGMVTVSKDIVSNGVYVADSVADYGANVSLTVRGMKTTLLNMGTALQTATSSSNETAVREKGAQFNAQIVDQAGTLTSFADRIDDDLVFRLRFRVSEPSTYDRAMYAQDLVYKVSLGLYALCILFCLLTLVVAFLNWSCGISFFIMLLFILCIVFLVLGVIFAAGLAVFNDVCPAFEPVIIHKVGVNIRPVASYYLFQENLVLNDVLNAAGLVDLNLVGNYTVDATTLKAQLDQTAASTVELDGNIKNVTAAIKTVIDLASTEVVHPLYVSLKHYACCKLPKDMLRWWTTLVFTSWMMLLLGWVSCWLLARLDHLDGGCCGCPSSSQKVHPDDVEENGEQGKRTHSAGSEPQFNGGYTDAPLPMPPPSYNKTHSDDRQPGAQGYPEGQGGQGAQGYQGSQGYQGGQGGQGRVGMHGLLEYQGGQGHTDNQGGYQGYQGGQVPQRMHDSPDSHGGQDGQGYRGGHDGDYGSAPANTAQYNSGPGGGAVPPVAQGGPQY